MARRAVENAPGESSLKLGQQFRDARDSPAQTTDVAAAHRLTRIRWRESMVEAALEQGELKLANDILDSIAKEAGDAGKETHDEGRGEAAQARDRVFARLDALRERLAQRGDGAAAGPATPGAIEGARS